jgi:hypothetical protein
MTIHFSYVALLRFDAEVRRTPVVQSRIVATAEERGSHRLSSE